MQRTGRPGFTVSVQDDFQRFGAPANAMVDVPAPTPTPTPDGG